MDGGVAFLDAAVATAAEQGAAVVEEGCADGDAAFLETEAGFVDGDSSIERAWSRSGLAASKGFGCRGSRVHSQRRFTASES